MRPIDRATSSLICAEGPLPVPAVSSMQSLREPDPVTRTAGTIVKERQQPTGLQAGKTASRESIDDAMAAEVIFNLFSLSFGPFPIVSVCRHRWRFLKSCPAANNSPLTVHQAGSPTW
jgi:hypothetical protein